MNFRTDMDIRPLIASDCKHLFRLDIKSSEFPWEVGDWELQQKYFSDLKVYVGCINGTPKGFSVSNLTKSKDLVNLYKLVVDPEMKSIGLDLALLNQVEYTGMIAGVKTLEFIVSETSCLGKNDPYDISEWLIKQGFKCEEIEQDMFELYGMTHAGFVFRKPISYGNKT